MDNVDIDFARDYPHRWRNAFRGGFLVSVDDIVPDHTFPDLEMDPGATPEEQRADRACAALIEACRAFEHCILRYDKQTPTHLFFPITPRTFMPETVAEPVPAEAEAMKKKLQSLDFLGGAPSLHYDVVVVAAVHTIPKKPATATATHRVEGFSPWAAQVETGCQLEAGWPGSSRDGPASSGCKCW
ncbi:hypothetical protein BOTBODRAFT_175046 [Botryobasidium botryosum FD-172 SS1]|uniref:Uncharacterized protein n=1 Tax=Botryobasidium botryosum (strain FD-172 SS1) TaxID=930990 RepID=A0A067MQQ9_BOTB1|nr:hypothetical protein BOTBODRAFT_175046 [Botryobasidium botryosum FD-172 SS1]